MPLDGWPAALVLVLGAALVVGCLWDLLRTAMGIHGGPLTRWVPRTLWLLVLHLVRWRARRRGRLRHLGMLCVISVPLCWTLLLVLGWCAVFAATIQLVDAQQRPVDDLAAYLAFTGSTLTTLGIGDLTPADDPGRLLTPLCTFTGLVTVTWAITWLIPVIDAAVTRQTAAAAIAELGPDPAAMAEHILAAEDDPLTARQIQDLIPTIDRLELQEEAYPVLAYLPALSPRDSLPLQLGRLALALERLRDQRADPERTRWFRLAEVVARSLAISAAHHPVHATPGWSAEPGTLPRLDRVVAALVALDAWSPDDLSGPAQVDDDYRRQAMEALADLRRGAERD